MDYPVSHRDLALERAAARVAERTLANGGGTFEYRPSGLRIVESGGWAVGLSGGRETRESPYAAILDWLYERTSRRDGSRAMSTTFGTWLEHTAGGDILSLDRVVIEPDLEAALWLAQANGQRAIYNLDSGETRYL